VSTVSRMLAPWQRLELFLGGLIRHNLAPPKIGIASRRDRIRHARSRIIIRGSTRKPALARQLRGNAEEARQRSLSRSWASTGADSACRKARR
jgi:hypothetical protein